MILWLNPSAGVSGDMLLGALLDLGAPLDAVRAAIESTGVTGWELTTHQVQRAGLRALHADVTVYDTATERRAGDLRDLVRRVQPKLVAAMAGQTIALLAETEAAIHGVPVDDVHLHELGALDTIVDVVGSCAALLALGVTEVWSAPVGLGTGTVRAAHGLLPAPAPATLALLAGASVRGLDVAAETVTPTGAALLRAFGTRYGPLPPSTLVRTGYGAGTRDPEGLPNVVTATLATPGGPAVPVILTPTGEPAAPLAPAMPGAPTPAATAATFASTFTSATSATPSATSSATSSATPSDGRSGTIETLIVLETTVDDLSGELLGALVPLLLEAGALDAWLAPVVGKKGRPAHVATALVRPDLAERVETVLLRETGSLGVRRHAVERRALPRSVIEVAVDGRPVRVKVGPYRAKPEHDDVDAAARALGLSRAAVAEQVLRLLAPPEPDIA